MNRITISVSEDLGEDLKNFAQRRGESVSGIVSSAIAHYLDLMRRKKLGAGVLDMIRNTDVPAEAEKDIDAGRMDDHRRT